VANGLHPARKSHKRCAAKSKPTQPVAPLQPDAAGLDIGSTELWVAVPPERSEAPVRCFGTFTADLAALVGHLKACGIRSVAMESTSLYWIPVYQGLADAGFEVCLVNARHVKQVPGRKSDVRDCQWLHYLHSVGLLRGSYRPAQAVSSGPLGVALPPESGGPKRESRCSTSREPWTR
jgi:hypothetical protein